MRPSLLLLGGLFLMACRPPVSVPALPDLEVQGAVLQQGPGIAPRPGDPPHRPAFSARVKPVGALPPGTTFWVMLLADSEGDAWRKIGGEGAVEARVEMEAAGFLRLRAVLPARRGGTPPRVGLELRQGDRVLLRQVVTAEEQFLPGAPARNREEA